MTDNGIIKACGEVCTDNRFELIAKYKQLLIDSTNIETAQGEMAVIDSILFRCWQMGWLDKLEEHKRQQEEIEKLQEKQTPQILYFEADGYADGALCYDYAKCPVCGRYFEYNINDWGVKYCADCGQALDWGDDLVKEMTEGKDAGKDI